MKKMMATAALAASLVGMSAAVAPEALATGDQDGTNTVNGNGSKSVYGNSTTHGKLSTQLGLVQGSLNDLCIGLPAKINVQSLIALLNIGIQDINVLSSPQNQQCAENSTQAKGDEALSHILDDIPILSANGVKNH
ncbi:RdlA protein [Streptomyces sp. NRRL F-4489]|uniref:rodlin n=1 Tax=Streptomyces sp. NRRL F-4489 TaxID=1609095 RepID=UPI00074AB57C|nr:rodlin [Streptomyces sp. NRRL F-4489]KUL55273.1 RdlA protein [Streptomyces sp. NRRL F-4489]